MAKWEYSETELWRHEEGAVTLMHVFGVIAAKNVVLAFGEAREGNAGDGGCPHSIFMRRSEDGGKSFTPTVNIAPAQGKWCYCNPVPVYDEQTGRIFLFYVENQDNLHTQNFMIYSDDLGLTWSEPEKVNHLLDQVADPAPLRLTGPGHGIQIKKGPYAGRLIVPFWHRRHYVEVNVAERGYCLSVLYSDDHGTTWKSSEYHGQECLANESRIVETEEGLLRVIRGMSPARYGSRSFDGGLTWTKAEPMAMGPANTCDAGAVRVRGKEGYENMVLVSRISEKERRWNMEILISYDGGKSFPDRMFMPVGDAMPGYSDLCVIEEDEPVIGLVHCRANHVLFSRISLQTLTAGKYENTKRKVWL